MKQACETPVLKIAENAGFDGPVIAEKLKDRSEFSVGFDAYEERIGDMFEMGVIDPAQVVISTL